MLTGYARISQDSQSIDLQIDALRAAGCEKIFSDTMSGSRNNRPGLLQALEFVRSADVICVWRLDRLGRSLSHLIGLMQDLERRGIGFRSSHRQFVTQKLEIVI
jgi:DNA invertase Pin-like site-specific DNA recombinase